LVIALVVARIGAEIKKVPKVRSEQDAKGKFTGITPTPTCAISSFKLLPPAGGRRHGCGGAGLGSKNTRRRHGKMLSLTACDARLRG
jgi:hypothetical protein